MCSKILIIKLDAYNICHQNTIQKRLIMCYVLNISFNSKVLVSL